MKWLLDTNTLSELVKPIPPPDLLDWLDAHESETAISAITIGEMVLGVERLPEGKKRRRLNQALRFLREDYSGRVLDFSEGAAIDWGRLVVEARNVGRNLSVLDSQIEATAVHYGLTVVTLNEAAFLHLFSIRGSPHEKSGVPKMLLAQ